MIPIFPKFKNLDVADNTEILDFVNKLEPYEDFRFVNLWSFDINNDVLISRLGSTFIVKFHDYMSSDHFYSFIGIENIDRLVDELLRLSIKEGLQPILKLVPQESVNLINKKKVKIIEDRDNFDYIISLKELKELKGKKYSHKRWKLNKFKRNYPAANFKVLNISAFLKNEILGIFYKWEKSKGLSRGDTEYELMALKRLLDIAEKLNLHISVVSIGSMTVAFSINEIIENKYAIGHFIKMDSDTEGIHEFFYSNIAEELLSEGCEYINIQQDLGIPGLRTAKESLRPCKFLKKFSISY